MSKTRSPEEKAKAEKERREKRNAARRKKRAEATKKSGAIAPETPSKPSGPDSTPTGPDKWEDKPESNRKKPAGNDGAIMHGAKPHLPMTPAQLEAIQETLDRVADLEADLAPARKKLESAKDGAEKAKKAVDGLVADRRKLFDHLVEIRSGKWQLKLPLGG